MSLAVLRTAAGDVEILSAELVLPLIGTPTYYLQLDSDTAPAGQVEIVFSSGQSFAGTVARASIFEGRAELVAAGGAGGLSAEPELRREVTAAGYAGTPFVASGALLVGDVLTAAGEGLSSDAAALIDALSLPRWQRVAGLTRHALGALARAWGVSWRVLADGRVWLGSETWLPYADEANVIAQGDDGQAGALDVALNVDRPDIEPGMTIGGRRVIEVTYLLDGSGLRARLRYEDASGGRSLADSLSAALGPTAGIYSAAHVARVVDVREDGTADLLCDTQAVSNTTGINAVPLRVGLARARQILPVGAEVILRFASSDAFPTGDPSRPYCEAIGQYAEAERGIARMSDRVLVKMVITTSNVPGVLSITPYIDGAPVPHVPPYVTSPGVPLLIETEGQIITASEEALLG